MKKIKVKPILGLRLLVAVLFLSASSAAFGQELIRGAEDFLLCDTSIVRVKSNDSVFVYNKRVTSTFMLISPGLTYAPTVYLDSIFVNDFEIYDKRIFFCGYKIIKGTKKAVIGNFIYNTFPYITINYAMVDTCTELKKLDIYYFEEYGLSETHLVMTGTTGTRSNVIVDLKLGAPYFCQVYFSHDETESFDDVAVTGHFVVVSSRKEQNGIPLVVFRRYLMPTMVGMSIFLMPINNLAVSSPIADSPIYLEHDIGDGYVAVYRVGGYSRMTMLKMNAALNGFKSVEIFGDEEQTIHPIDIKFNKWESVYDILARNEVVRDDLPYLVPMQIYHITPAVINSQTSYGNGTRYSYYYLLWSIDPQKSSPYFVASGAFGQIPRLFRYKHDEWEVCPSWFEYQFDVGELKGYPTTEETPVFEEYRLKYDTIEYHWLPILFPEICGKRISLDY